MVAIYQNWPGVGVALGDDGLVEEISLHTNRGQKICCQVWFELFLFQRYEKNTSHKHWFSRTIDNFKFEKSGINETISKSSKKSKLVKKLISLLLFFWFQRIHKSFWPLAHNKFQNFCRNRYSLLVYHRWTELHFQS